MAGTGPLDPAVAAVRLAVRASCADVEPGQRVYVACSGGADSMALATAAAFEGAKGAWQVGAIVIDHGLQSGSAVAAATVAEHLTTHFELRTIEPVEVVRVDVGTRGGPEAAARDARYAALSLRAAQDDAVVLLGHTRDDQAETVLLGLARGSGLRSLAGMRAVTGRFRRPFLDVTRAQTTQACRALELAVWRDPDNDDPAFTRVRVRRRVLPMLEQELGPGVAAALARTAELAAADADALDALAAELVTAAAPAAAGHLADADADAVRLAVEPLRSAHPAVRSRALRIAALRAGSPAGELSALHIVSLDRLVTAWRGQGPLQLPGTLTVERRDGCLTFVRAATDRAD